MNSDPSSRDSLRNAVLSSSHPPDSDGIVADEVRTELGNILDTGTFRRSHHSRKLLQTLVEVTLAGHADEIKEYSLAVDVLGRNPSFDPRLDPIVRVELGRLRKKLTEYYKLEGRTSAVRIVLPPRRYAAEFSRQSTPSPALRELPPEPLAVRKSGRTIWLLRLGLVSMVLIAGILWQRRSSALLDTTPGPVSIAVLPFSDLSPDPARPYLSESLTEEIIEALSHMHGLRVVSRLGSSYFKGKTEDTTEISRRLGVKYILEGSLNPSGRHVKVIARLVNAADGYQLWSKSIVQTERASLLLEERVARVIVDELRQHLGMSFRRPLVERSPLNPEAHRAYLRGVSFSRKWSAADLHKSLTFFEQTVSLDPGYAPAWSGLADTYVLLANYGVLAPAEAMHKARTAATRALGLDNGLAQAHATLAFVRAVYDWDWKAAESGFHLAHDLDPGDARIHEEWVTGYLIPLKHFDEALKQIREAQELDPVSARITSVAGATHFFHREYDRAIEQQRKALELDPAYFPAYLVLADAYAAKGMAHEAAAALENWQNATGHPPPSPPAGEMILPWLEDALRNRLAVVTQLNVHPRFDGLRNVPRFRAIAKRVGLPADR